MPRPGERPLGRRKITGRTPSKGRPCSLVYSQANSA